MQFHYDVVGQREGWGIRKRVKRFGLTTETLVTIKPTFIEAIELARLLQYGLPLTQAKPEFPGVTDDQNVSTA